MKTLRGKRLKKLPSKSTRIRGTRGKPTESGVKIRGKRIKKLPKSSVRIRGKRIKKPKNKK